MSKPTDRERAEQAKDAAREALRLVREALKACDDKQARALLQRAIDDISTATKAIKLPPKKREPKQAPYRGGGSWHPPGMMPGGRYRPNFNKESW